MTRCLPLLHVNCINGRLNFFSQNFILSGKTASVAQITLCPGLTAGRLGLRWVYCPRNTAVARDQSHIEPGTLSSDYQADAPNHYHTSYCPQGLFNISWPHWVYTITGLDYLTEVFFFGDAHWFSSLEYKIYRYSITSWI